jgi:hypothetical protein
LGASLFYNRGLMRFLVAGDREAAIADLKLAIQLFPDHHQAPGTLRALQSKAQVRWTPW